MLCSPSWEANWFAASQEIPRFSRNPKVHYRTHKRPPTVSILGQPNPVHIPTSHLLEIHPNVIHPSTPRSPQWPTSLRFPQQDPIHPPLSSPIRATCPTHLILLDFITRTILGEEYKSFSSCPLRHYMDEICSWTNGQPESDKWLITMNRRWHRDFWCTKWRWTTFPSSASVFPCQYHFTLFYTTIQFSTTDTIWVKYPQLIASIKHIRLSICLFNFPSIRSPVHLFSYLPPTHPPPPTYLPTYLPT